MNESTTLQPVTRRQFLTSAAAATTALGVSAAGIPRVFAAGADKMRVGLIGCGARGIGAAMNCVLSAPGVEIVALGDVFADRVEALGVGGRQWRTEPEYGNIYDHFGVRYRYANGAILVSTCRQIDRTKPLVDEGLIGTKGKAAAGRIEGANAFRFEGNNPNPYEQEHADLIRSIRDGKPLNEGRTVAEATLTAIIGRMSAYTGQPIRFDWALKNSELDLTPDEIKHGGYRLGPAPIVPPAPLGDADLV